jgi:hypothetical protein
MNTVQELKQQLAELSTRIDALETQEFTFTKDELIAFVREIADQAQEHVLNSVGDMGFDGDDITEVELCSFNRTVEVTIDEDALARAIRCQIEDMCLDTDDVVTTMTSIYNQIKTKQNNETKTV